MLSVCLVCQINCVGGITCGPRACSKSFFGGSSDTRVIHFLYARALAWTKKKLKKSVHLEMRNLRGVWTIFFLWFWRETNLYFIFFFMFICQNVGNFKGFLLVCLYRLYLITLSSYSSTAEGPHSSYKKKNQIKYLSVQLLIRGTCRVTTDGKSEWLFFP